MKRYMALVLSLMLLLSGCGTTEKEAKTDAPTTEPATGTTVPQTESKTAYEITYNNVKTYKNSISTVWADVIIEITNTGSKNLYLSAGTCDLEDANGTLVDALDLVTEFPDVLAPNEKGYMTAQTTLDGVTEVPTLTAIPHIKADEASIDLVRYTTSDIKVSDTDFGMLKVIGRVENTTAEVGKMVYVVAVLYGADGSPICVCFTILTNDLAAGDKVGFEISPLSTDIKAADVASYMVYAYPAQIQF